ncbi:MAG TPA: hypothetical protein VD970_01250, partial [Acetobacteraceae bacterium]|nr:hypothetical protein [Acetobacteraceae bacterium]
MTAPPRPASALLLAAERSGTHLLGSIADANGAAAMLGEVANARAAGTDDPVGFFTFQRLYRAQHPDRIVPNEETMRHLIGLYLDHIGRVGAGWARPLLLDV